MDLEPFYDSDEDIAIGPITIKELKKPSKHIPSQRYTFSGSVGVSSRYSDYFTPEQSKNEVFLDKLAKVVDSEDSVYVSALDNSLVSLKGINKENKMDITNLDYIRESVLQNVSLKSENSDCIVISDDSKDLSNISEKSENSFNSDSFKGQFKIKGSVETSQKRCEDTENDSFVTISDNLDTKFSDFSEETGSENSDKSFGLENCVENNQNFYRNAEKQSENSFGAVSENSDKSFGLENIVEKNWNLYPHTKKQSGSLFLPFSENSDKSFGLEKCVENNQNFHQNAEKQSENSFGTVSENSDKSFGLGNFVNDNQNRDQSTEKQSESSFKAVSENSELSDLGESLDFNTEQSENSSKSFDCIEMNPENYHQTNPNYSKDDCSEYSGNIHNLTESFGDLSSVSKSTNDSIAFNDTIEEMEMALKYGLDYEMPEDKLNPNENSEQVQKRKSEQIRNPKRDNFVVPNYDSYRTKCDNVQSATCTKLQSPKIVINHSENTFRSCETKIPSIQKLEVFKTPRQVLPTVKTPKLRNFKDIISPVSVYIKNSTNTPLKVNVQSKPVSRLPVTKRMPLASKKCEENLNNGGELKKVIYKPASKLFVTQEKAQKLPKNIQKLINTQKLIKHEHRYNNVENESKISRKLMEEYDENLTISESLLSDSSQDVSILRKKEAFIK